MINSNGKMRTYNRVQQSPKICVSKIKDFCRLCMNVDTTMYDIFNISEEIQGLSLSSKILKCLSIEVKDHVELPTKICACCFKSLNAFAEFWEQCHQTDKKLQMLFENTVNTNVLELSPSEPNKKTGNVFPTADVSESFIYCDNKLLESPRNSNFDEDSGSKELTAGSSSQDLHQTQTNEISNYGSSEVSLFNSDVDTASLDAENSSKFDLEDAPYVNESADAVEVQVSMNGNSYIVKVLEQPSENGSNSTEKNTENLNEGTQITDDCNLVEFKKGFYQCPHCKDSFSNSTDIKNHVAEHVDTKGYTCQFCFKWFCVKSSLVRHERIHSGERPYKCDLCARSFTQKEVLRRHSFTHSGDKPFKCEVCDKSYTQKEALKRHVKYNHIPRKLADIMQYNCSLCNKSFCHPSGLSRHQQSHAGRKFPCKNCDRVFTDQSCLKRHDQRVHSLANSEKSGKNIAGNTHVGVKV